VLSQTNIPIPITLPTIEVIASIYISHAPYMYYRPSSHFLPFLVFIQKAMHKAMNNPMPKNNNIKVIY
jgi:ubiquinone biosynthesis protein COQ9